MHPFRFKEVFFLDIFLNAINAGTRFSSGFYLAGGSTVLFPVSFAVFAIVVKVILFLGHRWQSRNQEKHFQFKSTVVLLSKKHMLFLLIFLALLAAISYTISVFEYSLPLYTFLFPIFAGLLLLPIVKTLFNVEKKETIRNYLYCIFLIFSLLIFFAAQMIYNKLY
jgi:4-hydroxybenzoate polyprenyltransferase